jgi:hypothetical protein
MILSHGAAVKVYKDKYQVCILPNYWTKLYLLHLKTIKAFSTQSFNELAWILCRLFKRGKLEWQS